MGLMKRKILQLLLTKLYNAFYPEIKCLHFPLHITLPYCSPKPPLLAAILRQQHVEKIIKNKYNNRNNPMLYCMLTYSLRSTD